MLETRPSTRAHSLCLRVLPSTRAHSLTLRVCPSTWAHSLSLKDCPSAWAIDLISLSAWATSHHRGTYTTWYFSIVIVLTNHINKTLKQDSLPAWLQEAYRPRPCLVISEHAKMQKKLQKIVVKNAKKTTKMRKRFKKKKFNFFSKCLQKYFFFWGGAR